MKILLIALTTVGMTFAQGVDRKGSGVPKQPSPPPPKIMLADIPQPICAPRPPGEPKRPHGCPTGG